MHVESFYYNQPTLSFVKVFSWNPSVSLNFSTTAAVTSISFKRAINVSTDYKQIRVSFTSKYNYAIRFVNQFLVP